ncbi:PREDICTED: mitogen-activated protein kinase kinase kinase NPK1-like [Nelumbo nucifera]|uniref:Mitogen-activated protein kinase kinase kinase NPK1-like n=2 Tax=Nelumbo nucifera TaxID=4432 RepID=A0A1U8PY08_NELNU|nr:PREDICTED: mitogen-activated protein kinase kinase kinase NPK1-like [Nelumbo nucifera]DAD45629.1 TPA_asm: hypothetical protein HUJ06_003859 [Nelumbo nucifera]
MKQKQQEKPQDKRDYENNGESWLRGKTIGRGGFSRVSLAMTRRVNTRRCNLPPIMAVKWAEMLQSDKLQEEREVLADLDGCPHIVQCFGDEVTFGNNGFYFNLLLEYGSGGSLAQHIKRSNGGLPESEVKRYTMSILEGLVYIHSRGYVHCDIKPANIILVPSSTFAFTLSSRKRTIRSYCYVVKIADFGLAKKVQQKKLKRGWRGTPLYLSPEVVRDGIQEAPADIWALGCTVAEMITGKPALSCKVGSDISCILFQISSGHSLPEVPSEMSDEGKDFLNMCFMKNAELRWTAKMLLNHPFIAGDGI